MSEYPKTVIHVYECERCGQIYTSKWVATVCCPARYVSRAWECGVATCETQIHRTHIDAEACIKAAAEASE